MGRELKRVPLDFDWPLKKTWKGYLNPHYVAEKCACCDGSGSSATAKRLCDQWYGNAPFRPEDRGSVPFRPDDEPVLAFARRNVANAPHFYGVGEANLMREATRLAALFNGAWSHHLNDDDVAALLAADCLWDFTRTWVPGEGWKPVESAPVPTAREVNEWSLSGLGHDTGNQWVVVRAECARLGEPYRCAVCGGEGALWPSEESKAVYEAWRPSEPPAGDGYQIWETVSEGSPISPVFATPEELARHMERNPWGADDGTPFDAWMKFILGPGWAPSGMTVDGVLFPGVEALALAESPGRERADAASPS